MELVKTYWIRIVILFIVGIVGVFSALPIIPKLFAATGQEPPFSMIVIQIISTVQSSAILLAMVMLGAWLSPKVSLGAPVLDAYLNKSLDRPDIKRILIAAVAGGILGGMLLVTFYQLSLPYLPDEFLENAPKFTPPFYTKILYGGITEEILIRWGMMSFFVWGLYRLTQSVNSEVRSYNYVIGIILTALIFGISHLPVASMLSSVVNGPLVAYIIIGNSIFGIIAGYLYWRRGLESAILAHMVAHVVMTIGVKII